MKSVSCTFFFYMKKLLLACLIWPINVLDRFCSIHLNTFISSEEIFNSISAVIDIYMVIQRNKESVCGLPREADYTLTLVHL